MSPVSVGMDECYGPTTIVWLLGSMMAPSIRLANFNAMIRLPGSPREVVIALGRVR